MWRATAGLVVIAGIILSFTWAWWAFIPGVVLGADFGAQSIANDPALVSQMQAAGLVWEAPTKNVVPG